MIDDVARALVRAASRLVSTVGFEFSSDEQASRRVSMRQAKGPRHVSTKYGLI